jgi:hypothetical protein
VQKEERSRLTITVEELSATTTAESDDDDLEDEDEDNGDTSARDQVSSKQDAAVDFAADNAKPNATMLRRSSRHLETRAQSAISTVLDDDEMGGNVPDEDVVDGAHPGSKAQPAAEAQSTSTLNSDKTAEDQTEAGKGPDTVDLTSDDVASPAPTQRRSKRRCASITIDDESLTDKDWTRLNEEGYIVLEGVALKHLKMHILASLKAALPTVHGLSNGPDRDDSDGGRWQEEFPEGCRDLVETRDKITALCGSLFTGLKLSKLLVLGSRANCRTQRPAHTDFRTETFSPGDTVAPLSIMIAIQKDTHLILYPGSHTWVRTEGPQRSTGMTIKLNRGDLVAWRGDLVHHGAPYKTSNIRIFLEARLPGHKEELNRSNDGTGKVVYRNYPVPWVEEPLSPEAASDEEKKAIETGQAIENAEDVD